MLLIEPRKHKNLFNYPIEVIASISYEDFFPGDIVFFQGKPKWRKKSDGCWEEIACIF